MYLGIVGCRGVIPLENTKSYHSNWKTLSPRIAKDSAEAFYNRLAVFHSSLNPFRYYLNPLNPLMKSLVQPATATMGIDLSMKPLGMSLPPPPPLLPFNNLEDRKRGLEEVQGDCNVPEKKLKTAGKRKSSKKLNFDEEKSSPVSGTLIRVLEEGESIPAVHKGEQLSKENVFIQNYTFFQTGNRAISWS